MKRIAFLSLIVVAILSGCANKSSTIERTSPCACYDIVKFG